MATLMVRWSARNKASSVNIDQHVFEIVFVSLIFWLFKPSDSDKWLEPREVRELSGSSFPTARLFCFLNSLNPCDLLKVSDSKWVELLTELMSLWEVFMVLLDLYFLSRFFRFRNLGILH